MQKNALRLSALDEQASAEGLAVGMTLADARARVPALSIHDADPAADLKRLVRLAEACRRFTPSLALHAPDGVDLDLTGCPHLFGGEGRLLMAARALMLRLGMTVKASVADTPALAWAAARYSSGGIVEAGVREAVLAPLPVEALRLEPDAAAVLRGLGFKRVGQVLEAPRAALARRLGETMLHRLDQALGRRESPLELRLEQPPVRAERRMFEPISEAEQVLQVAGDLATDLCTMLEARGEGGRRFALELFRVDGAVKRLEVAASRPLRHPPKIVSLFAERLAGLASGLQADFGFDQLRLTALQLAPMAAQVDDLLQETHSSGAVEALADRMAARGAIPPHRLRPVEVHTPEDADRPWSLSADGAELGEAPRFLETPLRPLRLFRPPQPITVAAAEIPDGPPGRFTWRRISRTVVRAEGPERLEPEWGRHPDRALARDYYRLEDEEGRRYWVFREGRYDAAPMPPLVHTPVSEEVKPVRPPPKAPPSLENFDPARARDTRIQEADRPLPRLRVVSDAGGPPPEAEPATPPVPEHPSPGWFLQGLFG